MHDAVPVHVPELVAEDEDGGQADAGGSEPDERHAEHHAPGSPLHAVLEGLRDGVVAIDGDHAEVEDGGGAGEDVEGDPEVAEERAEDPLPEDLVEERHGHDEDGDAEVGDGERDEEVVAGAAELADEADGDADEDVADDGDDDDHEEDEPDDDGLDGRVVVRVDEPGLGGEIVADRRGDGRREREAGRVRRDETDANAGSGCREYGAVAELHTSALGGRGRGRGVAVGGA